MTYRPAPVSPGAAPVPAIEARLEPDAIGVTQDVVIGTANAAPAVAVALTLAPLAAAAAYGSGPVIIVCGLPMLVIANSYRRLNLWKANCGASFEWVGHAISPYLGFLTGWLMIAGNLIGTTASTAVLGPWVLAVAGQNTTSTWPDIATSIVILARIMYGMAAHRVLPASLDNVSARFKTPATGSILTGLTLIAILWAYLLSSSIASAFTQLVDVTDILTAGFYILTALATIMYYLRRVFSNAWDALLAGILPFAAAAFLAWIVVRSLQAAPASQRWSVAGIIAVGVVLMVVARFALRSPFFQISRESASSREP